MGRILIISDLHLGHANMALKRGFKNVQEHDAFIINQWNSVVLKKDTVWILGDITMEKSSNYFILNHLNGIKKVVLGNHDRPQHVPELLKYVNSVCGMIKLKGFILTHAPIHESELGRFGGNIHGHVHEKTLDDPRYINVSCEVLNYTPILLESLKSDA
jgi:calcineurin-like phosphoesterase family protein